MSNSIWSLKGLFASPRYEIGDIYLTTRVGNPNTLLGYGTWELIPGKTLVCVDTSDTDFNTVKKTGGEKKHTLTADEIPRHNHEVYISQETGSSGHPENAAYSVSWGWDGNTRFNSGITSFIGGGQSHNNLQPYFTCYIWIRTA
jgi:microcystin-dependent protein